MGSEFSLKIFPSARADMEGIFSYIAEELKNPTAAFGLIDDFERAFESIRAFPESCPLIDNEYVKDKTLRKLLVDRYIAFFRIKGGEIQVIRVLYGMRNYQEIL